MKKFSAILALTAGLSISAFAADYSGYIVDKACSGMKPMWTNVACVQKCVNGGDSVVFVTPEGKVSTLSAADQGKVKAFYGKKVTITGNMSGDAISITSVKEAAM